MVSGRIEEPERQVHSGQAIEFNQSLRRGYKDQFGDCRMKWKKRGRLDHVIGRASPPNAMPICLSISNGGTPPI